jgi:hypothetical protein
MARPHPNHPIWCVLYRCRARLGGVHRSTPADVASTDGRVMVWLEQYSDAATYAVLMPVVGNLAGPALTFSLAGCSTDVIRVGDDRKSMRFS